MRLAKPRAMMLAAVLWAPLASQWQLRAATPDIQPPEAADFLRVRRDDQGQPQSLETAIVSHVPGEADSGDLVVDLIAAVHVGDRAYYERLNELFGLYDVVLYELVASEQARVPRPGSRGGLHPVSALQRAMKSVLDLEFQLQAIDYARPNLVHADMSPEEFAKSMRERGESLLQIYFRAMGQAMASQSQDPSQASDIRMLAALFARDRALRLKRIMAEQFESLGGLALGLDGPEGSTILTERNKRALTVLRQQIDRGRRRIGIFYGAAHMPDMQRRLESEFQLKRSEVRWLTAWNLLAPAP